MATLARHMGANKKTSDPEPLDHTKTTGWPEMERTLRGVDRAKIEDCKEDIDTSLVFAGLFAAVLTPFLAESYQALSEDPNVTSVALLRQISTQTRSYTITPGFFNSSAVTEDIPPFVAPPLALPTNILWFASLTLAVVTASFGMLVKQWLREFLSGDFTSPRARLRIRQFRNAGINDWKVFDIAAILPLLLQLSLALFFVGLCLFTWSVHVGIGCTTTPIVAGWALLFSIATFAPAFSARCPYKTALLKPAMQALRKLLCGNKFFRMLYGGPMKGLHAVEERDVVVDEGYDLDILGDADAVLLDDDLLASTMVYSLRDTSAKSVDIMGFVLKALHRRFQDSASSESLISLRELEHQSAQVLGAFIDISAQALDLPKKVPEPQEDFEPWMKNAIIVVLSSATESPKPLAEEMLTTYMKAHPFTMSRLALGSESSESSALAIIIRENALS
ncbi:hypothetical protein PHLCEN_2v4328 [Hermanssonia centrifuga]|uniref:DUF6535 domain-containing protein n=1 Tax=Hermanssonia centrifuga TaxID=98765 RepID=A0A2R6PVD2_9APHY|nr:hypothetical protein PHLCEN_2v4328 [Hermanssonia centrifuga]